MNFTGIVVASLFLSIARGQNAEKGGIVLERGMFSRELGMLDAERDEYASHLAAQAANQMAADAGEGANARAGRYLLVAKRLSPRNKRMKAVGALMREGKKPLAVEGAFTSASLAQLLLTRGKLLLKEQGGENHWVGRAFVEMAVELDPKNQAARKERENQEFDFGEFDWSMVRDAE